MNEELRRTGISITAEVPWGTHFCLFYKTKEDLLGILIPYFRAGLEDGEFCMWVTSEPLTKAAIKKAMKKAMPDFDSYVRKGTIEILSYDEWYVQNGVFDINKVLDGWIKKHDRARTMGCSGLRLTGNTFWLEKKDWQDFMAYEEIINNIIGNYRMLAVCTYSIDKCGAAEVIDVARTHQFALVNRGNEWNIITNTKLDHAKEKAEYFASFPQMNSNPVIEIDLKGRVTFNNQAATRILKNLGIEEDVRLFIPGDLKEIVRRLKKEKEPFVVYREAKIGGRIFGENVHLLKKTEAVRIYAHDVTELKHAEGALRESEERLRLAQANAGVGVWEWDPQKGALNWEPELENLYGLSQGTIRTYRDWRQRVHPEDIARIEAERDEALAKQQPFNLEFRAFHGSGEVRWMASMGKASYDEAGEIVRILGINIDITERKRTDEELKRLNRTLKALSNSSRALMHATEESAYLQDICKIIVEDCGHAMVWIGYAEEDEAKSVRPVAHAGFEEGYLEALKITWADTERGRGPTGTAIRTGKPCICGNMLTDPDFLPWREQALARGYASSVCLPLLAGKKAFGAITIYARESDAFLEDEVNLLKELAGDLAYGVTFLRMQAARVQADEALKQSEERYRTLFNSMTEGFAVHEIIIDEHGRPCDYRFLDINPSFERLTGLKCADILGKRALEVLPDDDPHWVETYGKVALTGEPVHFEYFSIALSCWYEVFAYRTAPRQFAVTYMDITKRKRDEEALREGEKRMNRAQEIAHLGSWELDLINNRLSWSDEVYRIFGIQPQEFSATYEAFLEAVHPDDRAAVDAAYSSSLSEGKDNYETEHRVVRKSNGEIRIVHEKCEHIRDGSGRIIRSVGMVHDITKHKQAEKSLEERTLQLEEINRELESFGYSVSHDLRAPLRAIDGYTRMILKREGDKFDEETLSKFSVIRNNAQMMGRLIDDLLAFSRLGRKNMTTSSLNMDDLIRDIWKELQIITLDRNMILTLRSIPPGYGDRALIKQVYFNLLSNAVKFTKGRDAAYIEVGGYVDENEDVYYVKDNGAGFDMKYYDKLFGVFQRLHSSDEYEGTGVGLAIVQRIVHRHGGRVWAEGKENEGAAFYFTLPRESR